MPAPRTSLAFAKTSAKTSATTSSGVHAGNSVVVLTKAAGRADSGRLDLAR